MWELIRVNKRNSVILLTVMAICLVAVGAVIGMGTAGPDGLMYGIAAALILWLLMTLVSFTSGDQILLLSSNAKRVTHDVHPQLFNVVEEMSIAAGLPMPKVYIINDPSPNAFATGRNPKSASIAVTAGLLARLNRDELQGVVAHEMSHILHRDILFVMLAGVMLGTVVLLSQLFLRSTFYGGLGSRRRYSSEGRGGGQAAMLLGLIALVAAIIAPILVQLLYFALSRKREYLADAGAARLTRYPEGLASALEKIAGDRVQPAYANKVTAPMYIVNPFKKSLTEWTSTHPPIEERIRVLRNMSQGVSFKAYSQAYSQVTGRSSIIPPGALRTEEVPAKAPQPQIPEPQGKHMRRAGDIIRIVNGFLISPCACGVTLKIPPNYRPNTVQCPRCQRIHTLQKTASKTAT